MDAGASGGPVAVIASASRPIDLVEHAAFGEVRLLGRRPAAEIGDCQKLELREAVGVAGGGGGRRRAEIMLGGERLPLRRVEELKIGLRKGPFRCAWTRSQYAAGRCASMHNQGWHVVTD